MFKILVLQYLHNLSDEKMEREMCDKLSWKRFLGFEITDRVPDSTTIQHFREVLIASDNYEGLFEIFIERLEALGIITNKGSIVDASFVEVPRQRNTRKQNEKIKNYEIPEEWLDNPNVLSHKDTDARWAIKNKERHFGYKNHVKCDKESKIITSYWVTSANVHDSQALQYIVNQHDNALWADSAYIGESIVTFLRNANQNMSIQINERGTRGHQLTDKQKETNRAKSKVRARVEHIFGHMETSMGGMGIRCVGIVRAWFAIMMKNLTYNIARFATIIKMKSVARLKTT
jgi:IS5 family transposase